MNTILDTTRHKELFNPYTFKTPVTVIGAGATGSWLVLQLARLGITNITVYDFDTVEEHNVPNQAYGVKHVGESKVDALKNIVGWDTGTVIKSKNRYFGQRLNGYVFLMVDSMAERKRIYEEHIKMKSAIKLLIEPRMGLDVGRIYNVNPVSLRDNEMYVKTYYSDDETEVSACGASLTVVTSAMTIASWCARQLINHEAGIELDNEILLDMKYNAIYTTKWSD